MLLFSLAVAALFLILWFVAWLIRYAVATRKPRSQPLASLGQQSQQQSRPGRRSILVAAAGAFLSLFMNWVDFWWIERSGLRLGMAALALVWLYPVLTALCSWHIHSALSKVCAATAIVAGLVVLSKTRKRDFFFFHADLTGPGVVVYLVCAVLFSIGVFRYAKASRLARKAKT